MAVAGVLTVIFLFLDRRNEELVHISEDTLEALEFQLLYANFNADVVWPRRRGWFGLMPRRVHKRPLGIFRRQAADTSGKLCDTSMKATHLRAADPC